MFRFYKIHPSHSSGRPPAGSLVDLVLLPGFIRDCRSPPPPTNSPLPRLFQGSLLTASSSTGSTIWHPHLGVARFQSAAGSPGFSFQLVPERSTFSSQWNFAPRIFFSLPLRPRVKEMRFLNSLFFPNNGAAFWQTGRRFFASGLPSTVGLGKHRLHARHVDSPI